MNISSASYSCAGGHEINEDSYLCSTEKGIFIVADGLGGHSGGEKASLAAIEYFKEHCCGNYTDKCIFDLLEGANKEVLNKGDGGKTTVAATFVENGKFIYANAGDSRVYYFRDGKVIAQTKDHSVCQASVDMGLIRPEDIRGNEDRSRLLKVLGNDENLNIKKFYQPLKIRNGDAFLVCSDGFWEYVLEPEMEADLLKSEDPDEWLRFMLKRHILRSENKGDNYTALCGMIHLDGNEKFAETVPEAAAEGTKKEFPLIPVIAAAAVTVAVLIASFFSIQKNTPEEIPGSVTQNTETEITPSETTPEAVIGDARTEESTSANSTPAELPETETQLADETETAENISEDSIPAEQTETKTQLYDETETAENISEDSTPAEQTETVENTSADSTTEAENESDAVSDTEPVPAAPSAARPAQINYDDSRA